jgi:hypothetical protein
MAVDAEGYTFDRTEPSYSVFRWTAKLSTDTLCSCSSRPNKTIDPLPVNSFGTPRRYTVTRTPGFTRPDLSIH